MTIFISRKVYLHKYDKSLKHGAHKQNPSKKKYGRLFLIAVEKSVGQKEN